MSTIIYLFNSQINIVVGKSGNAGRVKLDAIYSYTAPEGSIINGVITDVDSLREGLTAYIGANKIPTKDTVVVIESSKISGKLIEVPKLSENKTIEFCIREFADTGKTKDDSTFCYTELKGATSNKLRRVFAEAIPKEMLKDIADLFKPMGINLKGVFSHEGKFLNMLDTTVGKRFKSFSVHAINDNNMSNFLWDEGSYNFHNGQRFFNAIGTPDFFEETSRYFRQIRQFMEIRKMEDHREMIFYTGVTPEEYEYYDRDNREQGINHFTQILNLGLSRNRELNEKANIAIFAIAGLFESGRMADFIVNSRADATINKDADQNFILGSIILTGVVTVLALIAAVFSLFMKASARSAFYEAYEYNTSPLMSAQLREYDEAIDETTKLSGELSMIDKVRDDMATYPAATDDLLKIVYDDAAGLASAEITGFDASAGTLNFSAKAANVENINKFIDRLSAEEIFGKVSYTGYHYNEQEQLWNIDFTCILAESAGR